MKDFGTVLKILETKNNDFIHKRVYRNLINPEIYSNFDNVEGLINESYHPYSWNVKPDKKDLELSNRLAELLDAIFKNVSGYNTVVSPHIALSELLNFKFCNGIYIGNLGEYYSLVKPAVLDKILREKIDDERIIRLIHKFINANYLNHFKRNLYYSKTLGSVKLAEVLMNIYFIPFERSLINLNQERRGESKEPIKYIRYRDKFILNTDGSTVTKLIREWSSTYGETIAGKIEECESSFSFIEYRLVIVDNTIHARVPNGKIPEIISDKGMVKNINKKPWVAIHRGYLQNLDDLDIIRVYNSELRSLYLYYSLCENVSQKLGQLKNVMETSCLKTLAMKHRSSVKKVKDKYRIDNNNWGITQNGKRVLFFKGFKQRFVPVKSNSLDCIPGISRTKS